MKGRISVDLVLRCATQRFRKGETQDAYVKRITHINLADKGIEKIENLETFENLQALYLYDNCITIIENLDFAAHLTHLYLQDNCIRSISGLSHCPNLQKLFLGGNQIERVDGLEEQQYLNELQLQYQKSSVGLAFDIETLKALSGSLLFLNISNCRISDTSALAVLSRLEKLDLSNNEVFTVEQCMEFLHPDCCGSLQVLDLRNNPVCKAAKYRDYVSLSGQFLTELDGKPITETEREFLGTFVSMRRRAPSRTAPQKQKPLSQLDGVGNVSSFCF